MWKRQAARQSRVPVISFSCQKPTSFLHSFTGRMSHPNVEGARQRTAYKLVSWRKPQLLMNTESREELSGSGNLVLLFCGVVSVYSVLGLIVKGAIPQFEMFLTGGTVPIRTYYMTLLFLSLAVGLLIKGNLRGSSPYLFLAVYIVLDFVFLSLTTNYHASGILQSFYGYLAPLIVLALASTIHPLVQQKTAMGILWLLFVACLAVSTLQFITKTTVLPPSSADGVFNVDALDFYGGVRAFSLFTSGLEAGIFYCFIGAIAAHMLWSQSYLQKALAVVLMAASGFGCYSTLTRIAILGYVVCVLSATVIRIRPLASVVRWMPGIWLALALVLVVQATGYTGIGRADIGSTSSLNARLVDWDYYWQQYRSSAPLQVFFGSGMSTYSSPDMPNRPETSALIPIDNGFLQVLLHGGIVGLALVIILYVNIWRLIRNKVVERPTHLNVGAFSLLAAAPFFMAMDDIQDQIVMAAILCLITRDAPAAVDSAEPSEALLLQEDRKPVFHW